MKYINIFLIVFSIISSSCFNNNSSDGYNTNVLGSNGSSSSSLSSKNARSGLPIAYDKLESILGKEFIPVSYRRMNVDMDSDEEFVLAYRSAGEVKIKLVFFDILRGGSLQKLFEYTSEIDDADSYVINSGNLFKSNDMNLIIEGKNKDSDNFLYIINYNEGGFRIVGEFKSRFSNVIEYENIQDNNSSYTILREVVTLNHSFTSTNSYIQERNIYKWDENSMSFSLESSSRVTSTGFSPVNRDVYNTAQSYLDFIKGFWYPEVYASLIQRNTLNNYNLNSHNIEFVYISPETSEYSEKKEDYFIKFNFTNMTKVWADQPGLRLIVDTSDGFNPYRNQVTIEIFLLAPDRIMVKGPGKFDNAVYVRFNKPFIEYVEEARAESDARLLSGVMEVLSGSFTNRDGIDLEIKNDKSFTLTKNNRNYGGFIRLEIISDRVLVNFTYTDEVDPLEDKRFLLNKSDPSVLTLTRIYFDGLTYVVDDSKYFDFYRK